MDKLNLIDVNVDTIRELRRKGYSDYADQLLKLREEIKNKNKNQMRYEINRDYYAVIRNICRKFEFCISCHKRSVENTNFATCYFCRMAHRGYINDSVKK